MGPMFVQLFTHITNHLNDLNGRDQFDGCLRNKEKMQISTKTEGNRKWLEVKFNGPFNYLSGNKDNFEGEAKIAEGIRTDLISVHELVNTIVTKKKRHSDDKPAAITLFNKPLYFAKKYMPLLAVKKIAFYTYSHPIFFGKEERCKFIYKVYEIQKRNTVAFTDYISLDKSPVDMTNWIYKLPLNQKFPKESINQSPLWQVLYGPRKSQQNQNQQQHNQQQRQQNQLQIQKRFFYPYSVPAFLRIVCEHGRDITTNTMSGKLLKELHHTLPDALPKIHYALCNIGDADFENAFKSSLVKLLRHGPFGYKGFKIKE